MLRKHAPCRWTHDEYGAYDTECGNKFEVTTGTPEDNKMRFCPYCGHRLKTTREARDGSV